MNVNIDRAPILGEVPGLPGFYNCVSSNGYTLAPVLSRLTAEMLAELDQPAGGGVFDQAIWLTHFLPRQTGEGREGQATRSVPASFRSSCSLPRRDHLCGFPPPVSSPV